MNSNRRTYYKNFLRSSTNNQEPQAGTSKADDLRLNVVRKLTFRTPQKQKNAQKNKNTSSNKNNEFTKKPKLSDTDVLYQTNEQTIPVDNSVEQIFDLTNENNYLNQTDFAETEDSFIQKELEIFREIERQHEIEEACDQIRREHSNDCGDIFELNPETSNLNYENYEEVLTDISSKKDPNDLVKIQVDNLTGEECNDDLTNIKVQILKNDSKDNIDLHEKFENCNENCDVSENAIDLKCVEDFKKIDDDLQKNDDSKSNTSLNNDILKTCEGIKRPQIDQYGQSDSCTEIKKKKIGKNVQDKITCKSPEDKPVESTMTVKNEIDLTLISHEIDKSNETLEEMGKILERDSDLNQQPDLNQQQGENRNASNSRDLSYEENETEVNKQIKRDEYIKKKHLRQLKRQKYVDFLSDNEDFVWSSSSWEESGSESSETKDDKKKIIKKKQKKKQKKKLSNSVAKSTTGDRRTDEVSTPDCGENIVSVKKKRINLKKETKTKRETGQKYVSEKGKVVPAKRLKPNPCCPDKCTNKCYEISEERRNTLFSHFWSLDNLRRKDWLVSHSKKLTVKRRRTLDKSSRSNTFNYFINEGEGHRQVCQQFLLCTLDINQKTLYNTVSNAFHGSASEDMRGKHTPANKTPDLVLQNLRKYIQELPALPSHYCRKNIKRTYLPQEFRNTTNLYRIYKETQEKNGLQYVGERVFKKIFTTEFNIGFHFPRKDKCLKCTQFENDENINDEEKEKHFKDKEETTERFKAHQEIHKKDDTILCTTFDLQKVLNTPHGENMMLYYSRKLAVYNLTFYESGTRNGFCYTWTETNGKRGANEVSSILQKYIVEVDQRGTIKHLLFYCDSCPGQNKNKTVLACLNETLQNCTNLLSIQINYLLPGHTYMPVDSVHSVIEKSLSGVIIWAPSQWRTVFALARKSPKPYEVEVLAYNDFYKWDTIGDKYFKGNLVGKISKLRTVTFKKSTSNMAFVKYSMNPDAETEEIEIMKKKVAGQLKPCYKALLPVSKQKYMDLNKLCTQKVIPTVYHEEYKSLHYVANIQDSLIDTDIDDEGNDE